MGKLHEQMKADLTLKGYKAAIQRVKVPPCQLLVSDT